MNEKNQPTLRDSAAMRWTVLLFMAFAIPFVPQLPLDNYS